MGVLAGRRHRLALLAVIENAIAASVKNVDGNRQVGVARRHAGHIAFCRENVDAARFEVAWTKAENTAAANQKVLRRGFGTENVLEGGAPRHHADRHGEGASDPATPPCAANRERAERRGHLRHRMRKRRDQRERADMLRVVERERQRYRTAQRMPHHERTMQPELVDRLRDDACLPRDGGVVVRRTRRIAGARAVDEHDAMRACQRGQREIRKITKLSA